MPRSRPPTNPPYLKIAAELRARIASGALQAGDPVPSTREIIRHWRVAMATATRVLTTLRDEGLVRAIPGVGTVVAGRANREPRSVAPGSRRGETRADRRPDVRTRLITVASAIADAEGLDAVTFRRIAAELGTPTMSLYRHVPGKDGLVVMMLDAAFAKHPLPVERPEGWRAQLETAARLQWVIYRKHPWLAQALSLSFTRPMVAPRAMAHTEWSFAALDGLGLDGTTMLQTAVTLAGYVHGTALKLVSETDARHETGLTEDEWMQSQEGELEVTIRGGAFPMLAKLTQDPDVDVDLEGLFEFGLQRLLDGFAAYIKQRRRERRSR